MNKLPLVYNSQTNMFERSFSLRIYSDCNFFNSFVIELLKNDFSDSHFSNCDVYIGQKKYY